MASPDSQPHELVAIKVLRHDRSQEQLYRGRFEKEIRALAAVNCEWVPRFIRSGEHQGQPWYACELILGPTLHDVVTRSGPLPEETVWHLGLGMISALEAIHQVAAHRDLKPANVLLVPEGPRVIDFGVAYLAEEDHATSSQVRIGAMGYTAPEQQLFGLVGADRPADIYALGATLLFAATEHAAYDTWAEGPREYANLAGLPPALFGVISSCLYRDSTARPTLAKLRTDFAARAGAPRGPRPLSAVLPPRALAVIRDWRNELEAVIARTSRAPHRVSAPVRDQPHAPTRRLDQTQPQPQPRTQQLPDEGRPPMRTKIYPGTTPPPIPSPAGRHLRWQQAFGDWVRAPVAAAYRAVVAGSLDGTVACLVPETGDVVSSLSLGAAVRWVVVLRDGEHACAADAEGGVHLIELRTGKASAPSYAPGGITGTPVEAGGQLYTVSGSGVIYEIDTFSGDRKRLHDLREPALGGLAVAHGLLFATGARGISAIDIASGKRRWRADSTARVYSAPVPGAGRLYFAGTDSVLRSVSLATGKGGERVDIEAPVYKAIAHDTNLGLLYVPGGDGQVRAFDISGRHASVPALVWQRRLGEEIGGITAADGTAHCTVDGTVTGLDGKDNGITRYRIPVGGKLTAEPTLYGQRGYNQLIYVGGLDGTVSCVQADEFSPA